MKRFDTIVWQVGMASAFLAGALALAQSGHVVVGAGEIQWSAAPSSLPAGAQAAVLEGNPSEAEPFTMRLRLPANYKIPRTGIRQPNMSPCSAA